jgi:hypothetical protein
MKYLNILLIVTLVAVSNFSYCQNDCEKGKQDLAQIISGSYKCEISTTEYGGDGDYKKSQGTITISKVGENKIKVSSGSISYTINGISVDGNTIILGEEPADDNNGSKSIHLNLSENPAKISGKSANGTSEKAKKSFSFEGISNDNNKPERLNSKFVAQNVTQLDCHLRYLKTYIPGIKYEGTVIKAINKKYTTNGNVGKPLTIFPDAKKEWQRYDLIGQEALYFSQTIEGNKTEMSFYGDWEKSYQVWQWDNIEIDNLLDLTDANNLEILGLTLELLNTGINSKYDQAGENNQAREKDKIYNYEFTNSVSTWANKKYKGLIVPGARGDKNYNNIVLYNQADIDAVFAGKKGRILH